MDLVSLDDAEMIEMAAAVQEDTPTEIRRR